MRSRLAFNLLIPAEFLLGLLLLTAQATGQQPAPEPAPDATPGLPSDTQAAEATAKAETGPFHNIVTSSIELGVRGLSVSGNRDTYQSDLNYSAGFRVFDSSFLMESKDHPGKFLDTLLVNSSGWGGDPSGYLRINAEKTGWYKFDASVRRSNYFNSLENLALHQHTQDTRHQFGDYDLTLFPQNNKIKLYLGYSSDRNSGPAFTTYHYSFNDFPIFSDLRSQANDYRIGADARLGVFDLSFLQGFRYFKDDATYSITSPRSGNNPDPAALNTFERNLPTQGHISFTRFSLHTFFKKKLDFTGRFVYSSAVTHFNLLEKVTGQDSLGDTIILDQFSTSGIAKRPTTVVDLGATFFATKKLRISDTFRVYDFRINGNEVLSESLLGVDPTGATLSPSAIDTLSERINNERRLTNTVDADYQFNQRFSAHVGYRYTDRRIEVDSADNDLSQPPNDLEIQKFDNHSHGVVLRFKGRPVRIWTTWFDLEHGSADSVYLRTTPFNFTNFRLRNRIQPSKTLSLNFSVIARHNNNPSVTEDVPPQYLGLDMKTRTFTSSVDWTPSARFSLSSGYTYTRITSDAAVFLFINNVMNLGDSQYFMRDHFVYVNVYAQLHPRLTLFASYRTNKDTGQGDRVSLAPTVIIGSYPLDFQAPEFRLAMKLNKRIDWNIGYQYYSYNEMLLKEQNYHAHLPYTSLRIHFDRDKD